MREDRYPGAIGSSEVPSIHQNDRPCDLARKTLKSWRFSSLEAGRQKCGKIYFGILIDGDSTARSNHHVLFTGDSAHLPHAVTGR